MTGHTPCGIAIPQTFSSSPVNMQLIRGFLSKAETLGYESLWVQEQILGDYPILEPVSLLTYAAALTSRLRLGTSVLLTVLRNPVQLAKSLSSLDQLSQGRLTVGVGIGGHVPESLFGLSSEQRARRFVEGLQVMRALWTQPRATVTGTFWQFENVPMEPKPVQKPHPPLWFGAREEVALKRAVRHGDGWMGAGVSSSADFIQQIGLIRRFLDEAQRDPATFAISKRVYLAVDTDRDRAERRLREWFGLRYKNADWASRVSIWGSPAECTDKLGKLVQAGAQHLLLNPVFDEMEHLELLAQEVVPHL
jgi:probable F420-dependent oxidoreductase